MYRKPPETIRFPFANGLSLTIDTHHEATVLRDARNEVVSVPEVTGANGTLPVPHGDALLALTARLAALTYDQGRALDPA